MHPNQKRANNQRIILSRIQHFKEDVSGIALPKVFTFPFYYEPHPLAVMAAEEIQAYLKNQDEFVHNFGLQEGQEGFPIGKMFGVLVVKNAQGELGYLAAYSGNFSDKNMPDRFVPPIFDLHTQGNFFLQGEEKLNIINQEIEKLEANPRITELQKQLDEKTAFVEHDLQQQKAKMKRHKKARKLRRQEAQASMSPEAFLTLQKQLEQESHNDQFLYRELVEYRHEQLATYRAKLETLTGPIAFLKAERKQKSGILQQKIFDQYQFLNQQKTPKALTDIFPSTSEQKPPAGAGDCAAPKLLQYAFAHDLKPVTMAEFWWGASPKREVRIHQHYYPACRGRCKPILAHMLDGIEMDENPFIQNPSEDQQITIVFEDDALLVINKPPELLSVPGKSVSESVYTRMRALYPDATGPMMVHRLDMSTSGILVLAKTKEAHKKLQTQFIKRTVKKRYTALLDGLLEQDKGEIILPLRVDLDDRPRQLVCYEHGKKARTIWQVAERAHGKTKVHFYPVTGRTHQLRVHAAHPSGLNTPIVGDDLYGKKADRLHLHAAFIELLHPVTGRRMRFVAEAEF